MNKVLEIINLTHSYPNASKNTFENISLEVYQGEIFCLLGPSGCGKSTLLQSIAGFEPQKMGQLSLYEKDASLVPPERRDIGYVFQDYALFPHLTIFKNLVFGLKSLGPADQKKRVDELLMKVGLIGYEDKYPHELSGGEQQRVAIARALVRSTGLILFDEPFSNLDPDRRSELRMSLKSLLKENNITAIFVTHDQEEAFELADRVGILSEGSLHQVGTPEEIYHEPKTYFVARFIGSSLFLEARVTGLNQIDTSLGLLNLAIDPLQYPIGSHCYLYLPKKAIEAVEEPKELTGRILYRRFRGDCWSYDIEVPKINLKIENYSSTQKWERNTDVGITIDHQQLKTLYPKTR